MPNMPTEDQRIIDERDVEGESSSYQPVRWIAHNQPAMVYWYGMTAESPQSRVISHELAVTAMRQRFLASAQQPYNVQSRKALFTNRSRAEFVPAKLLQPTEPSVEVRQLKEEIKFLEAQLESQVPYLQLYRFGAGGLFVAIISIVVWLLTGTGIPFHPIFAAGVIPASVGVIVMAFLVRPKANKG